MLRVTQDTANAPVPRPRRRQQGCLDWHMVPGMCDLPGCPLDAVAGAR